MSLGNFAKSILGISAICMTMGLAGCATQKPFFGGNGYDSMSNVATLDGQPGVAAGYARASGLAQPASTSTGSRPASWSKPRQSNPQKRRSNSSSCFS